MSIMQSAKQNHWSLFIGHLVIERMLKAIYVQNLDQPIPRIHDLSRLAELAGIALSYEIREKLDVVTTFNISLDIRTTKKDSTKLAQMNTLNFRQPL